MSAAAGSCRPLKVGIQLPEVEREVRWPELRDMARAAEEVGFDSIWVGDHLLYRDDDQPPRGPDGLTEQPVARFPELHATPPAKDDLRNVGQL